ncbi:hypothetical protein ACQPZJ_41035 [Actinoplanes sp. CA-054009]
MRDDELTELVDRLRRDRRRHPYSGRREYSQDVRALAAACEKLLAEGAAAQAVPVLRKAVDRITRALTYMDDSSGIVGDDLDGVMRLYARACAEGPPPAAALAKWLVGLACDGPGWPRVRLRDFEPALGERGLAEVGRLTEARTETADPESWSALVAIRDLREQLAEVSGDIDRYVSVLAGDLQSLHRYERIVLVLRDAGRRAEAIAWARRGLAGKSGYPRAEQVRDLLVGMLLDDGDGEAALRLRREVFEKHPVRAAYFALADTSAAVGAEDPSAWAVTVMRDRVARDPVFGSELVDVLLALGRDDEAWAAGRDHAGEGQLLTLLERRRATHPAEVIGPYQELIERRALTSGDKQRYRRAVALLPALREAYSAAGDPGGYATYLADLRVRHARRPTFLKTLEAAPADGRARAPRTPDRPLG